VLEIEGTRASVIGRLEDKAKIAYTVFSGDDATRTALEENNVLIGGGNFGSWFVKAKFANKNAQAEHEYLLCKVESFKYEYRRATEAQVRAELKL
jgi:hypothetical protein